MSHELICEWLGLPPEPWPPDHYRLLGLEPGESDAELIERRVHERLDAVRHYQMMHPEQATEAMNRIAQAYVCLTEPATKQQYDAALLGKPVPVAAQAAAGAEAPAMSPAGPAQRPDPLAWLFGPTLSLPQQASATPLPPPRMSRLPPAQPQTSMPAEAAPAAPPEPKELIDSVIVAAQQSAAARRGLGTQRALYRRVVATRKLLRVWDGLGTYIEPAKRRLSRSADGPAFNRLLEEMTALLYDFPRLMGAAGQPGYLVLTLAEQEDVARRYQALDPGQREALSRDWAVGRKLLIAHRDFLRQEIRAMHKRNFGERLLRAAYALATDQPAALFVALIVLALGVALFRVFIK